MMAIRIQSRGLGHWASALRRAASRDSLWISYPLKSDENIRVGLAGTPFTGLTDYGSPPTGGAFIASCASPRSGRSWILPL